VSALDLGHHANLQRGITTYGRYLTHGPISENLFNGNVNVSVPIGQKFPVSAALSYQLTLVYNSNIWSVDGNDADGWHEKKWPFSNAGLGWQLSFGILVPPREESAPQDRWVYVSPDGSIHRFFSHLHAGTPNDHYDENFLYTRDGTYLRLDLSSPGVRVLEFPNGVVHEFRNTDSGGNWRATRLADRMGGYVDVSYGANQIVISDSQSRTQVVNFDAAGNVTNVDLTAFHGQRAGFTFSYISRDLEIGCTGNTESTQLLSGITGPEGATYGFQYAGSYQTDCQRAGRLAHLTLPEGGSYALSYRVDSFPSGSVPDLVTRVGLSSLGILDAAGNEIGRYNISVSINDLRLLSIITNPRGDDELYYFSTAQTTTANSSGVVTYGLPVHSSATAFGGYASLSHTMKDCTGGASCSNARSRWLSIQSDGACSVRLGGCSETNPRTAAIYTVYHDDYLPNGANRWVSIKYSDFDGLGHFRTSQTGGNFSASNVRVITTTYNPGLGASYEDTNGQTVMRLPAPEDPWILDTYTSIAVTEGASEHEQEFCFDPDTGVVTRRRDLKQGQVRGPSDRIIQYVHTGGEQLERRYFGGDVQAVSTGELCSITLTNPQYRHFQTWQHGTLAKEWWAKDASGAVSYYTTDRTIDPSTGLVAVERDSAGDTTAYSYDRRGRITRIEHPGTTLATEVRTYGNRTGTEWNQGPYMKSQWLSGSGQVLKFAFREFDSFGLLVRSRRSMPNNEEASRRYWYDAMGAKSAESSDWMPMGSEARNTIKYQDRDPFGRARSILYPGGSVIEKSYAGIRKITTTTNRGVYHDTGGLHEEPLNKIIEYDRQGRIYRKQSESYKTGHWDSPVKETIQKAYNSRGQVTSVTSIETGALIEATTYDGIGNMRSRRKPLDGWYSSYHNFDYPVYDARGNVMRRNYERPNNDNDGKFERHLVYSYDFAGRITGIGDADAAWVVWKTITYADGNVQLADGTIDHAMGRIRTISRSGWSGQTFQGTVTDRYEYGAPGGRISKKETSYSGSNYFNGLDTEFTQSYQYDALGNISKFDYPRSSDTPSYSVTYAYDSGFPIKATVRGPSGTAEDWVTASNFSPGGIAGNRTYSNGMTDTVTLDSSGMPRWRRVDVNNIQRWNAYYKTWEEGSWNSGNYEFDDGGDLVLRGGTWYVPGYYDEPMADYSASATTCPNKIDPFGQVLFQSEYVASVRTCTAARDPIALLDPKGMAAAVYARGTLSLNLYDINGRHVFTYRRIPQDSGFDHWKYEFNIYMPKTRSSAIGYEVFTKFWEDHPWYRWQDEKRYFARGGQVSTDDQGYWSGDPNF